MTQLEKYKFNNEPIRILEFFSGVGMQRMAFDKLGVNYESVGTSEIDIPAILSYAAIHDGLLESDESFEYPSKEEMLSYLSERNIGLDFKTGKLKLPKNLDKIKQLYRATILSKCFGDISKVNPNDLPDFDFMTYSSPCQDFSVAGKQQGAIRGQTRSGLLYECEKVIEYKRPKYLLLENVKNLVGKQFKPQFDEWLEYLETLGYTNYWKVLNSKSFGVPQNRERVFVLSVLGEHDPYEFHSGFELDIRLKDILEFNVDEKYYLSKEVQDRFKPNDKFKDMSGNIVGTTAPDFRTIGQRDLCYQENGIMGALVATDYKQPKQIIELTQVGTLEGKHEQSSRVYSEDGIIPTLMAGSRKSCTGGYVSPKIAVERIGGCFDTDTSTHQAGSVYDKNGLSPTLDTMQGGYRQPCITVVGELNCDGWHDIEKRVHSTDGLEVCIETRNRAKYIENSEPLICASRGRNPENPSDRTAGIKLEQRLEINYSGTSNTITTVQKDNYVLEPNVLRPERTEYGKAIRKQYEKGEINEKIGNMRKYSPRTDGVTNTLTTVQKDNYLVEWIIPDTDILENMDDSAIFVKRKINEYIEENGYLPEMFNPYNKQKIVDIAPTQTTQCGTSTSSAAVIVKNNFRIRKLTPKECWRLMGIDDECFDKAQQVNSNSQLYKQAGNGIVVDVLYYIFKELFKDNIVDCKES